MSDETNLPVLAVAFSGGAESTRQRAADMLSRAFDGRVDVDFVGEDAPHGVLMTFESGGDLEVVVPEQGEDPSLVNWPLLSRTSAADARSQAARIVDELLGAEAAPDLFVAPEPVEPTPNSDTDDEKTPVEPTPVPDTDDPRIEFHEDVLGAYPIDDRAELFLELTVTPSRVTIPVEIAADGLFRVRAINESYVDGATVSPLSVVAELEDGRRISAGTSGTLLLPAGSHRVGVSAGGSRGPLPIHLCVRITRI